MFANKWRTHEHFLCAHDLGRENFSKPCLTANFMHLRELNYSNYGNTIHDA